MEDLMSKQFSVVFTIITTLTFFFVGTPVQAEDNKEPSELQKITANPAHDYQLHEDIRLSLSAAVGNYHFDRLNGEKVGVGYTDVRASIDYRFWTKFSGGDVNGGVEVRGFVSSDTDGLTGDGGYNVDNGAGRGHKILDRQELSIFATLGLQSRANTVIEGTEVQVAWRLKAGLGGIQRNLIEEETLLGGFANIDISIRHKDSYIGGFIAAQLDWALEEGGHIALMNWRLDLGPEVVTRTMLRRVRVFGSAGMMNWGVLYEEKTTTTTTDLESIVITDTYLGGGVSATIGPCTLSLLGGVSQNVRVTNDLIGGGQTKEDSAFYFGQFKVELKF
jgi:hypothetical protein